MRVLLIYSLIAAVAVIGFWLLVDAPLLWRGAGIVIGLAFVAASWVAWSGGNPVYLTTAWGVLCGVLVLPTLELVSDAGRYPPGDYNIPLLATVVAFVLAVLGLVLSLRQKVPA